ncbi:MAG TPA: hypothetical protein VGR02_21370 [Thermoanaerobaculia bacterium]|jgi:hypothetical protein|nr:hypothetical protein [Thermoanaerobaculia bacterium]
MLEQQPQPKKTLPWREAAVVVGSITMSAAAIYFCIQQRVMWVLTPLPALLGIVYHLINLAPRYDNRRALFDSYKRFVERFELNWSGARDAADLPRVSEDLSEDPASHQPKLSSTLWGAAVLTAIFSIPAAVGGGGLDLRPINEAGRGLVYAGLGVYAWVLIMMVGRINSGGMSARFMITASIRSAVAMVLGYAIGATGLIKSDFLAGNAVYFLTGLFYPMALDYLKDTAMKVFHRKEPVTKALPLQMVDGVDDVVADVLTELGVWEVQHLATSDAGTLTVRSLFSFGRVTDWIDQAILITYVREKVVDLRALGIRGATDIVSLMKSTRSENAARRQEAANTLAKMASVMGVEPHVVEMMTTTLDEDYQVNLLADLSQHEYDHEGPKSVPAKPMVEAGSPMLSARGDDKSYISPAIVRQTVLDWVERELREEAAARAADFRAQNPDTPTPPAEFLAASYTEAVDAALKRALAGMRPTPGAQMRNVYDSAFMGELG